MADQKCFSMVRGRVLRVTALDRCGRPLTGPCVSVVTDGFISASFSVQTADASTVTVTLASGNNRINDVKTPRFTGYSADIEMAEVNPAIVELMTGNDQVYNLFTGDATGFRINSDVDPNEFGFALELWSDVPGVVCDPNNPDAEASYGYSLIPFLQGGNFGDFSIQNDAVNFTITGALTKDGSGWDVGPYDVTRDVSGDPAPLATAIRKGDHVHVELVDVAPPAAGCSCESGGVTPTGAVPGVAPTGGHFTPTDAWAPETLADMVGIVASPATAWTTGQFVALGNGNHVHWSSTAWVAGNA